MTQPYIKKFAPVIILFIITSILILIFKRNLISYGFDVGFLASANIILFLLSCFGFFIQIKGTKSPNVHAFIRGLYLTLLMKMFVIIGAIFIYIFVMGSNVNKPALFMAMVLYVIYTSIEVVQLMKIARKKTDA
ncbi:MAG TPA: hypothetical protein VIJ95_11690 [Hanamia sp.]